MTASFLWFSTFLLAVCICILTLSCSVARLSTCVTTTFERLTADQAAKNICTPAWLVLEYLLCAEARLLRQEWTFRTLFFFGVATVCHLGMAASLPSLTREITGRWSRTTWQWGLEDCSATVAGNVVKDSFFTRGAGPFMTEVGAAVVPALEWSVA